MREPRYRYSPGQQPLASSSAMILPLPSCSVYSREMLTTSCRLAWALTSSSSFRHSSAHSLDRVPKYSTRA